MAKSVTLIKFGSPRDSLEVRETPRRPPGAGEVSLRMLAAPVNPADINLIEGKYGRLPELPAVIGNEGAGRVEEVGPGIEGFEPGMMAAAGGVGTWTEHLVARAETLVPLPGGLDPFAASMLVVNPPTAWFLLHEFVRLEPGDWIVQNAANSAVGRCVIQIARSEGWKTLNVVRRGELIPELEQLGADVVVTEETDLRKSDLTGGKRPKLALNAVGGNSALNIANALERGGTHVTFGAMSRQPLKIPNGLVIFHDLRFVGFWLTQWKQASPRSSILAAYARLVELMEQGGLVIPIHATFPMTEVAAAVAEAEREAREGKVILEFGR